ncbi:MAG: glycosyltransferase family 4 protein [Chloroflexota bacterium]
MSASRGCRVLMLLENNSFPEDPRVRREARALADAGHRVSVISPAEKGQPWHETLDGVQVYRFPAPPTGDGLVSYLWEYGYSMTAAFVLSLLVFVREGFDVVHAANPPDTFVFVAAPYKLLGKRFVYDHHDLSPEMYYARFRGRGNRMVHGVLARLERVSCRLADQVIATNESYKAVQVGRDGVPEERVTIVRNGPELAGLRPVEPFPQLRREGKTVIGFAGVMGSQDGVDYLLRALHHLRHDLGRADFLAVLVGGKGDSRTRLRSLSRQLGLGEQVQFTGWVSEEDWLRYLASADICVDPDPSNPFNDRSTMMKVMEYMAAGKPVVAFDLPEHRFTAREAALYVPPSDEREMARALALLMDDPELRQAMGAFGRRRVETELAWQHSIPELLGVYERLLPKAHPEAGPREERAA